MASGGKREGAGKPKGTKHKKTVQWEQLADSIIGKCAERFEHELFSLEGKDFVNAYIQVLNYFKPKYQSTELKAEKESKVTIDFRDAE
jgi:hypothetical protein